ncbi:MAG: hypothetical protein JXB62_18725 [Pirellulales bacterium]|nr:hypothetical protein [Pirellulales bacterium]
MKCVVFPILLAIPLAWCSTVSSEVVLSGRVRAPLAVDSGQSVPMTTILVFASLDGPGTQARGFRTWETEPVGWYQIKGEAGDYTMVFSNPAHFMRPIVVTDVRTRPGETIDRVVVPRFDFSHFPVAAWDDKPAGAYYQTFVAKGTSVTQVGFRVVHDGVDGQGPGKQDLAVSIHRHGPGTPDTWPQIGPVMPVLGVDGGGAKNYPWSAGWDSGEVPLKPGETYAVCVKAASPDGTFQAFWQSDGDERTDCYRVGPSAASGFQGRDLHLAVGSDGDGLVIPYNKRVHKQFTEFAGFRRTWSQTYVAKGQSLASVILYAATGGTQPPMTRQRVAVRVRQGGPDGPVVGVEKIAFGNGFYTGDASWGTFGVAFARGEVPLAPGQTYAIEWQSLETPATLRGFVNCKGQVSDEQPGFNPYRKCSPDSYEPGTAYNGGQEAVDYDLDVQVIEYESADGTEK